MINYISSVIRKEANDSNENLAQYGYNDVALSSLIYKGENKGAVVFDGLEKAKKCISNLWQSSYLLDDFEVGRPTYLCVVAA